MKKNLWSLIWSSFLEIQGALITFIGIFLSIFLARFPVKNQVPLDVFIIILLVLVLIIVTIFHTCNKLLIEYTAIKLELEIANQNNKKRLIPKIISARHYPIQGYPRILCLLEESILFSQNILVSCYYTDNDGFEIIIASGSVINIQEDRKIQVLIDEFVDDYQDILEKLANNDRQILPKVLIKPTVLKS
jgi:hypothetical protein